VISIAIEEKPGSFVRRILIATGNRGKLGEIEAVYADLPVQWCTLAEFPGVPEVVEDGATLEDNAEKKALHYAAQSGLWTLADDSGLEVDALGGQPGVHSARYSSSGLDADNNRELVAALQGVPHERRTARFVCCLALAEPGRMLATARGTIAGQIIDEPRGTHGFGYDPHFWVPELGRTTAELTPAHKNRISHRGNALRALGPKLSAWLQTPM
jgi:XTP/dITP diphosphohydrolase